MKKTLIFIFLMFIVGLTIGGLISQLKDDFRIEKKEFYPEIKQEIHITELLAEKESQEPKIIKSETEIEGINIQSPSDWVKEEDIRVYSDRVEIKCQNCQWANFANTKSMVPILDQGHNAIQIIPEKTSDIKIGDIVSYDAGIYGTIIHRVIKIGYDEEGWYAIFKGDNNPEKDPFKVRWEQIKRKLIAIIY
jgi:signal peptidase I